MMLRSLLTFAVLLVSTVSGLRVTRQSPCEDVCGGKTTNTTSSEIVCRDHQFNETQAGRDYEECVTCELQSDYHHRRTSESDVQWGIYNLRYLFSSCIYSFPAAKQSVSTPCQVTCESLRSPLTYRLQDPTGISSYDFCGMGSFSDEVVTKCAQCYRLTENEKILANFVEAIRQGCHSKVRLGERFVLDPARIFTTSRLPPSTSSVNPSSDDEGDGPENLVLIIVLPIIGFLLVLSCLGVGCFLLVRRRRRQSQRDVDSGHLHERWNDTSIITPVQGGIRRFLGEPTSPPNNSIQSPGSDHADPGYYHSNQQDVKCSPEAYTLGSYPSVLESKETKDPQKSLNTTNSVPIISPPTPRKSRSNS